MLAGKRRRMLSVWMSLIMAFSIGIPSGVYAAERQQKPGIHVHGKAGFCSDGYYYTGKCIPVITEKPGDSQKITTVVQPAVEASGTSIQLPPETSADTVEQPGTGTSGAVVDQSAVPETSDSTAVVKQPTAQETPDSTAVVQQPTAPETPDSTAVVKQPAVPETPDSTAVVKQPTAPETPDSTAVVQQPTAPETPDSTVVVDQPAVPETPDRSTIQKDLVVPLVPDQSVVSIETNYTGKTSGHRTEDTASVPFTVVLGKQIGVEQQISIGKTKDEIAEKEDAASVVYQCQRYPYFTVTFVDQKEGNQQEEVRVVPALPEQFPLTPPDFKDRNERKLSCDNVSRSDDQFLGWSEDPKATEAEYSNDISAKSLPAGDKTLYAVWGKKPDPTGIKAKFFIRLDSQVPIENGTIQYAHAEYTAGELSGQVDGKACWTDYSGVIDEKTGRIAGTLVDKAFESVQIHIQKAPSDEAIQEMMKKDKNAQKQKLKFNPETQRVIWYVVKQVPSEGKNAWHVDGVICSKYAHEMLQYHGNAGGDQTVKGIPSMQMHEKDADAPIIFTGVVREGYEFCGWSEDPNATPENLEYPKDGKRTTIRMDGEKHLYAVWKAKPSPKPEAAWRIIYDANQPTDASEVSGMPEDGINKRNGVYELSTEKPVCSEGVGCTYEFKGWSLQDGKDGNKQELEPSVTINNGDVTVYAIWERIPKETCTVTVHYYSWNKDPDHLYGSEDQLAEPVIAVKGYAGQSYMVDEKVTAQKIIDGYEYYKTVGIVEGKLTKDEEINVLYKETPPPVPESTYAVNYDANVPEGVSVSGMPEAEMQLKKGSHLLSTQLPTRPAEDSCTWECKGWSLQDGKDGNKQDLKTSVTIKDSDVTVYAIWERIPKEDPSGGDQGGGSDSTNPSGGDQGGGSDSTDPSGGGTHNRDHSDKVHNENEAVIIPDAEVPLASQPASPPEVTIPDQAVPLASNPEEQTAADETGVPLSGISKLPKTGGIGAGLVIGIGALLIAAGLLIRKKERRADR